MRILEKKVREIEKKIGTKRIPPKDRLQVVVGDDHELEEKKEQRLRELVEKYGPDALEEISIIGVIDRFTLK